jgi:hypothetical protein
MSAFLEPYPWLEKPLRILLYFLLALLVAFLLKRLTGWLMHLGRKVPGASRSSLERHRTLQSLVSSTINLLAFVSAALASGALFVNPDTLAWVVGLFSAAFGFGARFLVSDYLGGLNFLFEDTFAVGEKIEIPGPPTLEGVVEHISLRTTMLRSPSGELYIVPNGEIRTVLSRDDAGGKFIVVASIRLAVEAHPFEIGLVSGAPRGGREDVDPLLAIELGALLEQEFPGAEIAVAGYDKVQKDARPSPSGLTMTNPTGSMLRRMKTTTCNSSGLNR